VNNHKNFVLKKINGHMIKKIKENEHHYVYDLFGHGKVIAQSQALN
jgi:hypothetical protein